MSREFDFSRLFAGYSGAAVMPKRLSPGVVIGAVDVFAVVVGLAAMHVGGMMWGGVPSSPAAPSLISPVDAAEQTASAWPDPHLRPVVAAVHLTANTDAALMFAAPVVTAPYYSGDATFTSPSSPAQQAAASTPEPAVDDPPSTPTAIAPPVAKLADIAVTGHLARHVVVAADTTLDDLLLSRGSAGDSSVNAGASAALSVAVNAAPSGNVGANIEVASATPVVSSVANAVGSTVGNTVGGVANVARGLLN